MEHETLLEREFFDGKYSVRIYTKYDDSPDFSYLGEFCHMDYDPVVAIYHRNSGLMYFDGKWVDDKGRFAEAPYIHGRSSREYECIAVSDCQFKKGDKHWLKYAFQNCKRLNRLDDYWHYLGVVAEVKKNGYTIGKDSVWGIESDAGSYLMEAGKECLTQAFQQAKETLH